MSWTMWVTVALDSIFDTDTDSESKLKVTKDRNRFRATLEQANFSTFPTGFSNVDVNATQNIQN
eukprot:10380611-Ditylum_brightwellii.AAC.1